MVRLGFLFPGQGAQYAGMGKDLVHAYAEAKQLFAQADSILNYNLSTLCFEGPVEQLNQTEYAQPALLTTTLAILKVAEKEGVQPTMLAGLSLGEYTALTAAGALTFQEALPLVQKRGRLMQQAVPAGEGSMAAVLGLDHTMVELACQDAPGAVDVANYNCPGQVVIAGEKKALEQVSSSLKAMGARVIPLAVSVPSHCRLMAEAAHGLTPYLTQINWQEPGIQVVSNVNAHENSASQFPELLAAQLVSPVLWEQSVRYMLEKVDYLVEVGPGSTLSGLIKKIDKSRLLGHIEDWASLKNIKQRVNEICNKLP